MPFSKKFCVLPLIVAASAVVLDLGELLLQVQDFFITGKLFFQSCQESSALFVLTRGQSLPASVMPS